MRFFNAEGPVVAQDHYQIPPLARVDLDYVLSLIRRKKYFILHAPRQTGKTSALIALQDLLNGGTQGAYRCVYVNVEAAQAARHDVASAMETILDALADRAQDILPDSDLERICDEVLAKSRPGNALHRALKRWAQSDPRPLVLLIDEIDSLIGDTLISVLRQLRSGYDRRPHSFPQSVVLCGVRDVRDYRIFSKKTGQMVMGGSAFNINAKSLRLGDFDRAEVEALLGQHTADTGQAFEPAALELVWTQTAGQPWLVNALCWEACFENPRGKDRSRAIRADDILAAREVLVESRAVHLDQLAHKLREDRVQRVIEALLTGADEQQFSAHDYEYVRDLGLIAASGEVRIANPIYAEVVPRELTFIVQKRLRQDPAWYIDKDGKLNLDKLLAKFQEFFRANSEHWLGQLDYKEAGPQLLLQAFLQRVLNGGGVIAREFGLGRGRVDLYIQWPRPGGEQQFVIECKVLRGSLEKVLEQGLRQTAGYMDRCGAAAGHLVIFDPGAKPWEEKIYRRTEEYQGRPVEVWGM